MDRLPALLAIETVATAFWTGSSAGFAFVSAPLAFHLIQDRDLFARLTEGSLGRLTRVALVAGGVAIAAALLNRSPLRAGIGLTALTLLVYHERAIVPAMTQAQAALGSFNAASKDDPKRIEYGRMHKQSTRVFGAALLLGVGQLVLGALSH